MRKAILYILRTLTVIMLTSFILIILALGAGAVMAYGPSQECARRFVATFDETSALKFVPRLYFTESKIQSILNPPQEAPVTDNSDGQDGYTELEFEDGRSNEEHTVIVETPPEDKETIEIIDIKEPSFKGKLMLIHDPSKVAIGALDEYGEECSGLYLEDFISKYGAAGGTNAGGFYDPEGTGDGGIPDGLVIKNGKLLWGLPDEKYYNVVGFDKNNILRIGDMCGGEALDMGLISAVSFTPGPILVKDGEIMMNLGGGMNPRTCIGQASNGTILLIVLEGRKPDSPGATYDDAARIMFKFGAVNAVNLDGGSSSLMYYGGKQLTRGSNLVGMRRLSTAILIFD